LLEAGRRGASAPGRFGTSAPVVLIFTREYAVRRVCRRIVVGCPQGDGPLLPMASDNQRNVVLSISVSGTERQIARTVVAGHGLARTADLRNSGVTDCDHNGQGASLFQYASRNQRRRLWRPCPAATIAQPTIGLISRRGRRARRAALQSRSSPPFRRPMGRGLPVSPALASVCRALRPLAASASACQPASSSPESRPSPSSLVQAGS